MMDGSLKKLLVNTGKQLNKANNTGKLEEHSNSSTENDTTTEHSLPSQREVLVEALPKNMSDRDIEDYFSTFGAIESIQIEKPSSLASVLDFSLKADKQAKISFRSESAAKRVVDQVTFFKQGNDKFNAKLANIAQIMGRMGLSSSDQFRAASYFIQSSPQNSAEELLLWNGEPSAKGTKFISSYKKALNSKENLFKKKKGNFVCSQKRRENKKKGINALIRAKIEELKEKFELTELYIRDFPSDLTEARLKWTLEGFGQLTSFKLVGERRREECLGGAAKSNRRYCIAGFSNSKEAVACMRALKAKEYGYYVKSAQKRLIHGNFKELERVKEKEKTVFDFETGTFTGKFKEKNILTGKTIEYGSKQTSSSRFSSELFYFRLSSISAFSSYSVNFDEAVSILLQIQAETPLLQSNMDFFFEVASLVLKDLNI